MVILLFSFSGEIPESVICLRGRTLRFGGRTLGFGGRTLRFGGRTLRLKGRTLLKIKGWHLLIEFLPLFWYSHPQHFSVSCA